jgi:hypothetical protein
MTIRIESSARPPGRRRLTDVISASVTCLRRRSPPLFYAAGCRRTGRLCKAVQIDGEKIGAVASSYAELHAYANRRDVHAWFDTANDAEGATRDHAERVHCVYPAPPRKRGRRAATVSGSLLLAAAHVCAAQTTAVLPSVHASRDPISLRGAGAHTFQSVVTARPALEAAEIGIATLGETVKPALRNPTLYGEARCNDGTPFTFLIQKGYERTLQSRKWVIYLKGGVFCDDDAFVCSERARNLTTTSPMADGSLFEWDLQGILSDDPAQNPDFYKANRVYALYCSSDYWAGKTNSRRPSSGDPVNGWYFSGRTNVNAMLNILMSSFGLADSSDTNVIWAGGSAGSFGAQLTANQAARHLPNTFAGGRLRLLNDAGWMPDWDDPNHRMGDSTQSDREMYRDAFAFWGASVDPACKAALADAMDCVLAPGWYDFYKSQGWPIFLQSSATDSAYMKAHGFDDLTPQADVESWSDAVQASMTHVDWLFSSSDATHTLLDEDGGWSSGPTGDTLREVVRRFARGGTPERVTFGELWDTCNCGIDRIVSLPAATIIARAPTRQLIRACG